MRRGRAAAAAATACAAADEFGFSLGPLFSASPVAAGPASGSALAADGAAFTSDAVHSEAELQAIIARLQHDDARSPDARSQRTAAAIPDMAVGARARAALRFANSSHAVDDAPAFYHARLPAPGSGAARRAAFGNNGDGDHAWTQAEVGAFVAAYLTHPKEFGVIAACVPHKSMNACVQFYYRNKKQLRLKALEAKANRRASRRSAQPPAVRRRKDRARDRRDRRAREERARIAAEAAASLAANNGTPPAAADADALLAHAGALERRSRSSALLRSIVQAGRQSRKDRQARSPPRLAPDDDSDADADADASDANAEPPRTQSAPPPAQSPPSQGQTALPTPATAAAAATAEAEEEEDGELVDITVRSRRARGSNNNNNNSDQSLSDASNDSRSRASPQPQPPAQTPANDDDADDGDEVVEASGVVADRSQVRPFPRIVSRKSQSRFDVTLTAILDSAAAALGVAGAGAEAAAGMADYCPTESALDRFVTEELSAHRRPISSYETLLICSSAATNSPTRINNGLSSLNAAESAVSPLDALVEQEAGPSESVLVGAAAWLRDDRRRVLRALHRLGADFAQVASLMPSKTMAQCRYFYYHYRTPAGALISEVIPNALTAASASAGSTTTAPAIGSLVLPPLGARNKPDPANTTPLAAQLANVLAAAAAAALAAPPPFHAPQAHTLSQPPPPPPPPTRHSSIAQVPVDVLVPRMTPISSLVLPPKQPHASESPPPLQQPPPPTTKLLAVAGDSSSAASGAGIRSPSSPPPMTAKKSGYSSYWSVHERSAFMHYAVRLGQDWQGLADAIGSKTGTQVRNYFRANRERLQLDVIMCSYA
ncbi:DNA-binding protein snt1 [Coemansia sp. RSA 2424]|nr:DNA-binding protein snt1 [Coemansia sp. RSA 2424]